MNDMCSIQDVYPYQLLNMIDQPPFWFHYGTMFSIFFQHDVCVNSTRQNAGSRVLRYTESSQSSRGIIYKYNGIFLLGITPGHMFPKCINGFSMATKWHIYFEWGWQLKIDKVTDEMFLSPTLFRLLLRENSCICINRHSLICSINVCCMNLRDH